MQDKQKVTLYLPPELHRQLKIKAAVDARSMSTLVEKAVHFYLHHQDVVEETLEEAVGKTYQVHVCPDCQGSFVIKNGETISLKNQPTVIIPENETNQIQEDNIKANQAQCEEKLVTC